MSAELQAVIRHFPNHAAEIERRGLADQEFLLLCEDLADAEAALAKWARSAAPVRELRTLEYQALVDELLAEVGLALTSEQRSTARRKRLPD